ncbi:hypothetical protein NB688_000685 [Xanthomonas sacchari]|uniref:Uncharacterized protein n=1 Tax=Xanthomonas sacchari TaxID=56458 RepID=A0ABT3DU24_9XANT|nr:hypothetical protein [Xanthomonas sacchari]MCW0418519.1 hypothetical protein [Xanthomonas sacchari]
MPPSPPNPSAVSRYGASAGDTIARKTRPQCIEDIDARPTAFLVGPLQRDKTLPVTPSRLRPLLQESEVVRCRCHVGRMDSRRSGTCRCSGSAATFGLQRVVAEALPTKRATPHDADAMSSPWMRAEAACAAARDQRRPSARHASRLRPLLHVHGSAVPERRANNILRGADTGQRRGLMRRRFSRQAWSAGSSARRSGRSGRAGFPASRCALLPIPGCRPGAGG